ncbi:MAG TPA: lamin tail domain-containing protein [Spirochaetota bacterium]|nr:lamin tail domain-containing protein [Spirochaetota bacterium]
MSPQHQSNVFTAVLFSLIAMVFVLFSCDDDSGSDSGSASYTNIVINEVQSTDTDGFLESDFVELYNTSKKSYTFSEGEWYLTDSDGIAEHVFYIPGGTVIAGRSYLVLLTDETTVPADAPEGSIACVDDGTNDSFGLGSDDGVYLYYTGTSDSTATLVDSTQWDSHVSTRARKPDGGDWDASDTHTPTPGESNDGEKALTSFSFASLGVTGLIDEDADTIAATVPSGTDVTALVATFTFNGESVSVNGTVQASGTTANNFSSGVTYTVTATDGSTVEYTVTVTVASAEITILINEVQSDYTSGDLESDFVELYNTSDQAYTFNGGEWYITDSKGASEDIFYIPDGTTIAAYGYLVLLSGVTQESEVEGTAPSGSLYCVDDGTNKDFGLGSGDAVYLYYVESSGSTATLVDSTEWDSHVSTRARKPDGGDWAATDDNTQTPGATNGTL